MENEQESSKSPDRTAEYVVRSVNGDLHAFRKLVESQERFAYAVAYRLLADRESARDAVQQAFIRVWNNLDKYRSEIRFTTWLYKIVVNLCYDRIKMEKRRGNIFTSMSDFFTRDSVAGGSNPHEELEKADLRERILSEARNLPPRQYLVFQLRDIQDFSIDEIAEMAGISVGAVKTNLFYARRRIRLALSGAGERWPS